MSELKEHIFCDMDEVFPRGYCGPLLSCESRPYYLKSEADKVIAEKDKEISELQKQVHDYAQGLYVMQARAEKELRHHKYKRCLAMAERCHWKKLYWRDSIPAYSNQFKWENRADKWHKRWLAIAEKFKPNNEAK